jgi:heat shock protein HslJ
MRLWSALFLSCAVAFALATPAPAREIAGELVLPDGFALPAGAELHLRLGPSGAPDAEQRRPLDGDGMAFVLAAPPSSDAAPLSAAVYAGGWPILVGGPVDPGDGPVALTLRRAVLPGGMAPLRCGDDRLSLAPDPGGLRLRMGWGEVTLPKRPDGTGWGQDSLPPWSVELAGNRWTVGLSGRQLDTCLPDIPAPVLPLSASGTDPVWSAAVTADVMALAWDDGAVDLGSAPDLRAFGTGLVIFAAPDMNMEITPGPCADAGTGAALPYTVRLSMPGTTLSGCGGDPAAVVEGDWRVVAINGAALPDGVTPLLSFDGPRLTGNAGCNRLTATVAWDGPTPTIARPATTRMACPAPAMTVETALLDALPAATGVTYDAGAGVLRLMAGDRAVIAMAPTAAN